jgi:hypothetical protein
LRSHQIYNNFEKKKSNLTEFQELQEFQELHEDCSCTKNEVTAEIRKG